MNKVITVRKTILTLIIMLTILVATPALANTFTDISGHWAEQDIILMEQKGVITGVGMGKFNPNQAISRQEVLSTIIRFMGKDGQLVLIKPAPSIEELLAKGASDWAVNHIIKAHQEGYITDGEVRILNWSEPATRQEVAGWIGRALNLSPVLDNHMQLYLNQFQDKEDLNYQQVPYLVPLVRDGIIFGRGGYFKPYDPITRGEMTAILNRVNVRYAQRINHIQTGIGTNLLANAVEGELIALNWFNGYVELNVNGSKVHYSMTPILREQLQHSFNWQQVLQVGDIVELFIANGQVNHINKISSYSDNYYWDGEWTGRDNYYGYNDVTIYKGTLDRVDTRLNWITLRTVRYMDGGFRYEASSRTFDFDGRTEISYNDKDINKNDLRDYEDDTVYIAYDECTEKILQIRVLQGTEYTFDDQISSINTRSEWIELESRGRRVYYDDRTMVVIDGRLVTPRDLQRDDEVYVVADRSSGDYGAAIIEVKKDRTSRSSDGRYDDNMVVYKGTLEDINSRRDEITLRDVSYLSGTRWRDKSGRQYFELASRPDIYYDLAKLNVRDLEDHLRDNIYLLYDQDRDEVVSIWLRYGSEDTYSDEIRRINTSREEIELYDKGKIYYDSGTIVVIDGQWLAVERLRQNHKVYIVEDRIRGSNYAAIIVVR